MRGGNPAPALVPVRRLATILMLAFAIFAATATAAPTVENQARVESTIRFLQSAQNDDGGFGGSAGGESSQLVSAWVALALASAGINPQDQRKPGGADVYEYLSTHFVQSVKEEGCAPVVCTTTFERELMVVNATGTSPRGFDGVDLVEELLHRERADGSFPHVADGQAGINDTIFAIFALSPVEEPKAQEAVRPAAEWVAARQQPGGGWAWRAGSSATEVDMTGAAIQALAAGGMSGSPQAADGLRYLREAQNPDGGFPEYPGERESNAASTAWAVQAIWAAGENPEDWTTGSGQATEEPLDFLESLQDPVDGHVHWKPTADQYGVWMTAYTTPAYAGKFWPFEAPPRGKEPESPAKPGEGEGKQSGDGVIAGGGGGGAEPFSRPQPQSKGKTPGGARLIHRKDPQPARNHSSTRRGPNAVQPSGTESAEDAATSGEVTVVDSGRAGNGGASLRGGEGGTANRPGGSPGARGSMQGVDRAPAAGRPGEAHLQRVTGFVVGSSRAAGRGDQAFGAPGLHGSGADRDAEAVLAAGIGIAAVLVALGGVVLERRREESLV